MIRRSVRWITGTLGAFAAAAAVVVIAMAWRLSLGPVSLEFMTPAIETALSRLHSGFDFRIGRAAVEWSGPGEGVTLRLEDAQVIDSEDGVVAHLPTTSVSLSARGLASGVLAPVEITLYQPHVYLRRSVAGIEVQVENEDPGSAELFQRALDQIIAPPNREDSMSDLERIQIVDADLIIEDVVLGTRWQAPVAEATIWRQDSGFDGEMQVDVRSGGERGSLVVAGKYRPEGQRWEIGVAFGGVRPRALSAVAPVLAVLESLDAPMWGTLKVGGSGAAPDAVSSVEFDLSSGAGHVSVPAAVFGVPDGSAQDTSIAIEWLSVRGTYAGDGDEIAIAHAEARLPSETTVQGPGPTVFADLLAVTGRGTFSLGARLIHWEDVRLDFGPGGHVIMADFQDFTLPVRRVEATGSYDLDRKELDLAWLSADLGGPALALSATLNGGGDGETPQLDVDVVLEGVPLDDIEMYWPPFFQPNARDWVAGHMSAGRIARSEAGLAIAFEPDGPTIVDFTGSMNLETVELAYLPPLPPLRGLDATAEISLDTIVFAVTSGSAAGVSLDRATVTLAELDSDVETAAIDVFARGRLPDVLALIDHDPLRYAEAVGIDPTNADGRADLRITLEFPLLADLPLREIDVAAEASLEAVKIGDAILGRDIHSGSLALRLDKSGIDVTGTAALETIRGAVVGRENFADGASFQRRIHVDVDRADLDEVQHVFFDGQQIPSPLLNGDVSASIVLTRVNDDYGTLEADLDFEEAFVAVPHIGWTKHRGHAARVEMRGEFEGRVLRSAPWISVDAEGLMLAGSADFGASGDLERIDIDRASAGRTDAGGSILRAGDNAWELIVRGSAVDLAPYLEQRSGDGTSALDKANDTERIALTVDVGSIWLASDRRLGDVAGTVVVEHGLWRTLDLVGRTENGSRLAVRIDPDPTGQRVVSAQADDAGSLFRTLGLFETMAGGTLALEGTFDDSRPSRPLEGRLTVADYHVRDAPALAQILGMLALTEIGNTLRGDGLSFDVLDVPFTFDRRYVTISEAQAASLSLGITASGTLDTETQVIDVRGSVTPIYALNGFLGRVPVVGYLFNGGEKGSGIFAATYSVAGTLDDTDVMVNPLAALTPGMFRKVFRVFDGAPPNSSTLPLETTGDGGD